MLVSLWAVTKEEAVWESFSEDEAKPAAPVVAAKAKSSTVAAGAKGKGGGGAGAGDGGKAGQGNIMSFFGKK